MSNTRLVLATFAIISVLSTMFSLNTVVGAAFAQATATATSGGGGASAFADIAIVQNSEHIVVTITKIGAEAPEGPVIVPEPDGGDDGTIITPADNGTEVVIIEPGGEVTEVEGNVTHVDDNSTVVVSNSTVTETEGNVTVIDPPAAESCACPPVSEEGSGGDGIADVVVTPAPGQNVTIGGGVAGDEEEPAAEPSENVTTTEPTEPFPEPEEPAVTPEEPVNGNGNGNVTAPEEPVNGNVTTEDLTIEPATPAAEDEPIEEQAPPTESANESNALAPANFLSTLLGISSNS